MPVNKIKIHKMVLASGEVIKTTVIDVETNELGVSCETQDLFTPTEIECQHIWASKHYNQGNNDASYNGSTSYSFMPIGCVVNKQRDEFSEADWVSHAGRMYYNQLDDDYTSTKGRSIICKTLPTLPTLPTAGSLAKERIDLDFTYVVVTYCNALDDAQQWLIDDKKHMVYTKKPNRCLSLAPNAVDLTFPCPETNHAANTTQKNPFRIDSNSGGSNRLNHDCFDADRTYGNYPNQQLFADHANLVTQVCSDVVDQNNKKNAFFFANMVTSRPLFKLENGTSGALVNLQSGKCIQVGGDMVMQCMEMYDTQGKRPGINDYISPSVYPAYLYPCGKGCRPHDVQSWVATPITPNSKYSLIRLRNDNRLCLRSGIDSNVAQPWTHSKLLPLLFFVSLALTVLTMVYEFVRDKRRRHLTTKNNKKHVRHVKKMFTETVFWLAMRLLLSLTGPVMLVCVVALNLPNSQGGRSFYPRTMVVHGTLFAITTLFTHVMLVSRHVIELHEEADQLKCKTNDILPEPKTAIAAAAAILRRRGMAIRKAYYNSLSVCCERPSVILHAILITWPRGYDTFVASAASTWSGVFYFVLPGILVSAYWQVATSSARFNVGIRAYAKQVCRRWSIIMLAEWCVLVSTFFGPDGTPSDSSNVATNIVLLGVVAESILGTTRSFSEVNFDQHPHLLIIALFCLPLILLSCWEVVAMAVSHRDTYGTENMVGYGAVGGTSNQLRGKGNFGYWYGSYSRGIVYFQWACYLIVVFCLNFSIWLGKRCAKGPKAPDWLQHVLKDTNGRIPLLQNGAEYHFFISKQDGTGPHSGKNLAYTIGHALREVGFKVWLSQFEVEEGHSANVPAMQRGIEKSEMILLLLTPGIFHFDRVHVTHTELKYGIETLHKPVVLIDGQFNSVTKIPSCGHLKECCDNVRPDFQYIARALVASLTFETWSYSHFSRRSKIAWLTNEYILRQSRYQSLKLQLDVEKKATGGKACPGCVRSESADSYFADGRFTKAGTCNRLTPFEKHIIVEEFRNVECVEAVLEKTFETALCGTGNGGGAPAVLFDGPTVLAVNPTWVSMCGYTEEDIVGNTMNLLQGPQTYEGEALSNFLAELDSGMKNAKATLLNYHQDGSLLRSNADIYSLDNKNRFSLGFFEFETIEQSSIGTKEEPPTVVPALIEQKAKVGLVEEGKGHGKEVELIQVVVAEN
jgi:hypothetical protein